MKKHLLLFALVLGSLTSWAYDFSAVAPSGQVLYYNINGSEVSVVSVDGVVEITVFDMLGRVVGTYRDVSVFSVSALAKDSYIVKVVTADGHVEYRKLIKQ